VRIFSEPPSPPVRSISPVQDSERQCHPAPISSGRPPTGGPMGRRSPVFLGRSASAAPREGSAEFAWYAGGQSVDSGSLEHRKPQPKTSQARFPRVALLFDGK